MRPPFSGVLSEVMVEKGQFVRAGEPLMRLTDVSRVEIPVSLGMDDFLQLKQLMAEGVRPRVHLAPGETEPAMWSGFVTRTAPEADVGSRTVPAFVDVDNSDSETPLLPGSFVYSRIEGGVQSNAILIPRETIISGHVYVARNGDSTTVEQRKIKTGRRVQSLVTVTEGLEPSEKIVLTNLDIVEHGQRVTIQSERTAADELAELRTQKIELLP
ncbi:MAG: efflux RND transporter periplasmic adaptor subunit [Planctomycetaceae bacterium]